MYYYIK